jgi:aldehyde dehydrogenase (NAD+)
MTDKTNRPFTVAHPDRFFIDGQWVAPSTGDHVDLIDPTTEHVFMTVAAAANADMDRAVTAARAAFDTGPWPRLSAAERAGYLRRLAEALRGRTQDLAIAQSRSMGAPLAGNLEYTGYAIAFLDMYADIGEKYEWEAEVPTMIPGSRAKLVSEPVGVVAAIAPWNGPLYLILPKVAPALMAGCTVIMKPAPSTPLEALIVAECAEAVGFPAGVINVLTADNEVSNHLVLNPGVDKVAFTGSTAAGRKIASEVGSRIGRYTLELGGKSAALVLEDFDIAEVGRILGTTVSGNTGQFCTNLTRMFVPRAKQDAFVAAAITAMKSLKIGNPFDAATAIGPLGNRAQFDRVTGYVTQAIEQGQRLVVGGGRPADQKVGYFFEPTLFVDVDNKSTIAREEIFGPVGCVIPYDTVDEAIAMANDSPYGLAGSVFTHDAAEAYRIARAIRTGTFSQNGLKFDFSISFGGFKQSGVGREGGREGLKAYIELKTVILDAETIVAAAA